MTSASEPGAELDPRPVGAGGYRLYRVRVARSERLSPHFVRLVLTGPDLDIFGTDGLDQRIKVLLPNRRAAADRTVPTWGDLGADDPARAADGQWYARWRALPQEQRNTFRTYTVRGVEPTARELTVDFVVHPGAGPAGSFAETAETGDELLVAGPDARSPHSALGIDFHPGAARHVLLAGDETALPAIASILEHLDDEQRRHAAGRSDPAAPIRIVHVFLEVPETADELPLRTPPGAEIVWAPRDGADWGEPLVRAVRDFAASHGDVLRLGALPAGAVPQPLEDIDVDHGLLWEAPDDPGDSDPAGDAFAAWIAGEAGAVKALRRLLVREHGVDRHRVAFMGYWRRGRAESSE